MTFCVAGRPLPHRSPGEVGGLQLCQQCIECLEYGFKSVKSRGDRRRIHIQYGWIIQEPSRRSEVTELGDRRGHQSEQGFRLLDDAHGCRRRHQAILGHQIIGRRFVGTIEHLDEQVGFEQVLDIRLLLACEIGTSIEISRLQDVGLLQVVDLGLIAFGDIGEHRHIDVVSTEEPDERGDLVDAARWTQRPPRIKSNASPLDQRLRCHLQIEDVGRAFDQPCVRSDEERLSYFVAQRALEREERVVVDFKHVGADLRSLDLGTLARFFDDHVLHDADIGKAVPSGP